MVTEFKINFVLKYTNIYFMYIAYFYNLIVIKFRGDCNLIGNDKLLIKTSTKQCFLVFDLQYTI